MWERALWPKEGEVRGIGLLAFVESPEVSDRLSVIEGFLFPPKFQI